MPTPSVSGSFKVLTLGLTLGNGSGTDFGASQWIPMGPCRCRLTLGVFIPLGTHCKRYRFWNRLMWAMTYRSVLNSWIWLRIVNIFCPVTDSVLYVHSKTSVEIFHRMIRLVLTHLIAMWLCLFCIAFAECVRTLMRSTHVHIIVSVWYQGFLSWFPFHYLFTLLWETFYLFFLENNIFLTLF